MGLGKKIKILEISLLCDDDHDGDALSHEDGSAINIEIVLEQNNAIQQSNRLPR